MTNNDEIMDMLKLILAKVDCYEIKAGEVTINSGTIHINAEDAPIDIQEADSVVIQAGLHGSMELDQIGKLTINSPLAELVKIACDTIEGDMKVLSNNSNKPRVSVNCNEEKQIPVYNQILELENRLLKPEVRHSVKEIASLLADDFIEYGSSGRIYDKQIELESLPASLIEQLLLSDFSVKLLAPDVALATYHITKHCEQDGETKHTLRSSIWRRSGDTWQLVFHQGTPTNEL